MEGTDPHGNGVKVRTPGFGFEARGQWSTVILIVTLACAVLIGVTAWSLHRFTEQTRQAIEATNAGHTDLLSALDRLNWTEQQSQCLMALPAEGEDRVAALRNDNGACHFVLYLYTPRLPTTPPARPAPTPDKKPPSPSFPTSGFPAHPDRGRR
jgi:hypothetical protein